VAIWCTCASAWRNCKKYSWAPSVGATSCSHTGKGGDIQVYALCAKSSSEWTSKYYCKDGTRSTASAGYMSSGGDDSTRSGQTKCGGIAYYCKDGKKYTVGAGYYTTGGDANTRSGQAKCGGSQYFCKDGKRSTVSKGYYSSGGKDANTRTGQTKCENTQLSGWSAKGDDKLISISCPKGFQPKKCEVQIDGSDADGAYFDSNRKCFGWNSDKNHRVKAKITCTYSTNVPSVVNSGSWKRSATAKCASGQVAIWCNCASAWRGCNKYSWAPSAGATSCSHTGKGNIQVHALCAKPQTGGVCQ